MIISGQALQSEFVGPTIDLEFGVALLNAGKAESRQLFVVGESGVGKTRLVAEIASRLNKVEVVAYLDALAGCANQGLLTESIAASFWHASTGEDPLRKVPEGRTFREFVAKQDLKDDAKTALLSALTSTFTYLAPRVSFPEPPPQPPAEQRVGLETTDLVDLLVRYLRTLSKRRSILIVIDNAQELSTKNRLLLQAVLQPLDRNVGLATVIRTNDFTPVATTVAESTVYANSHLVTLGPLGGESVAELIRLAFPHADDSEQQALYRRAGICKGNAREVEQFVLNERLGISRTRSPRDWDTIDPIVESLLHLSEIERQIVALASLFPDGIDTRYLQAVLRLSIGATHLDLDKHLDLLAQSRLIYLNGPLGRVIRPQHERIVRAAADLLGDDEVLEIRRAAVEALQAIADRTTSNVEYLHVVNMVLDLLTVRELGHSLHYLEEMISRLSTASRFAWIADILRRVRKLEAHSHADGLIIGSLSHSTIERILEAFQRTSRFEESFEFLDLLCATDRGALDALTARFRAKSLVQTYRYEEALSFLASQKPSEENVATTLNCLQHCRRDDEAHALLEESLGASTTNWQAQQIMLRNAAHLLEPQHAVDALTRVRKRFADAGDEFLAATAENNLGIAYLYDEKVTEACICFRSAKESLSAIGSREYYQPRFNEGLAAQLEFEPLRALECYGDAIEALPAELLYDKTKFESNRALARYQAGLDSADCLLDKMEALFSIASDFPDPWLGLQIGSNLASALVLSPNGDNERAELVKSEVQLSYPGRPRAYGLFTRVSSSGDAGSMEWILACSPHWRH